MWNTFVYDQLPSYLLGKFQLTATVVFAVLFSLVIMLMSIPFSNNIWFSLSWTESFAFTVVFFLIATLVVVISKKLMYDYRQRLNLTYLQYSLWCFSEAVIISLLYTFFTMQGIRMDVLHLESTLAPETVFFSALGYMTVSLGVPYVVAGQYFAINEKNNIIRLMNFGTVVSDEDPLPLEEQKITLFDSAGVLKLSVSLRNLYYIESDDNYVRVWYSNSSGELKQYMLRCKLKTIEDSFRDSSLLRCHRKYIVNMNRVNAMSRDKNGYVLDLDNADIEPIPVSKTYEEAVLDSYNDR